MRAEDQRHIEHLAHIEEELTISIKGIVNSQLLASTASLLSTWAVYKEILRVDDAEIKFRPSNWSLFQIQFILMTLWLLLMLTQQLLYRWNQRSVQKITRMCGWLCLAAVIEFVLDTIIIYLQYK